MGLSLVNTAPGASGDPITPGQAAQLGLRDSTGDIELGTLRVTMGFSDFQNEGLQPEVDPNLKSLGMLVAYETTEHRRPITGSVPVSISGRNLVLTRSDSLVGDQSVYELQVPIEKGAPVLGYVKFKKKNSWSRFNPDWCNQTNMVAPYIGLEHGTFNNACYVFLQDVSGVGKLVMGGPLSVFGSARPGQQTLNFDWMAQVDGGEIELFIYYNVFGFPSPFSPAYTELVEVWARRIGIDVAPQKLAAVPTLTLGEFQNQSSNFPNIRLGPSDFSTLIVGNAGHAGDVLEVTDWAIFPDYRVCVSEGEALSSSSIFVTPDLPVSYHANLGKTPRDGSLGIWLPIADTNFIKPACSFRYQAGRKTSPYAALLTRSSGLMSGFYRDEPRLGAVASGAMVEAFLFGEQNQKSTDTFGASLSIEDGVNAYRAILLQTATVSTIGIQKSDIDFSIGGYYVPTDGSGNPVTIDWTSPKLVRLTLDRARSKIILTVDEEDLLEIPTSDVVPASTHSRIAFGHMVQDPTPRGNFGVIFLNYLTDYRAFEGTDGTLPSASGWTLQQNGLGSDAFDSAYPNSVVISKDGFSAFGTYNYYTRSVDFADTKGFLIDFSAQVISYMSPTGESFVSNAWTGAALQVLLGNKKLTLGFFDCGTSGRVIGIVPGSGSEDDIINQTDLGRKFSAAVDWTQKTLYRLVYKAYGAIQVWAVTVNQKPLFEIPWRNDTDGFDLPNDSTAPALQFGHFEDLTASKTAWGYIRWGVSSGYDVAVQPKFDSLPAYLFGGKALIESEFDE